MADDPGESAEGVMDFINRMRADRKDAGHEDRPAWLGELASRDGLTGVAWKLHQRIDAMEADQQKAATAARTSLLELARALGEVVGGLRATIYGATAWLSFLMFVFWIWK